MNVSSCLATQPICQNNQVIESLELFAERECFCLVSLFEKIDTAKGFGNSTKSDTTGRYTVFTVVVIGEAKEPTTKGKKLEEIGSRGSGKRRVEDARFRFGKWDIVLSQGMF